MNFFFKLFFNFIWECNCFGLKIKEEEVFLDFKSRMILKYVRSIDDFKLFI